MHNLTALNWALLLAGVFAVAFFYSSVGHGGATGYLATLALLGVAPASARVAVLIANVLVAGSRLVAVLAGGTFRLARAVVVRGYLHAVRVARQPGSHQPGGL